MVEQPTPTYGDDSERWDAWLDRDDRETIQAIIHGIELKTWNPSDAMKRYVAHLLQKLLDAEGEVVRLAAERDAPERIALAAANLAATSGFSLDEATRSVLTASRLQQKLREAEAERERLTAEAIALDYVRRLLSELDTARTERDTLAAHIAETWPDHNALVVCPVCSGLVGGPEHAQEVE